MSEIVQRAAAAILTKVPEGYGMTENEAREYAKVVIMAMREPTAAMNTAGADARYAARGISHQPYRDREVWRAMIDEAAK